MFSTSGDVQYIEGCSVHRGGGDIMSTSGVFRTLGEGIMMHVGEQGDKAFQFILKTPMYS